MLPFAGVGMGMKMGGGAMPVSMEMIPLVDHAAQHIGAQQDQHDADGGFQHGRDGFRHGGAKQQDNAADSENGQGMPGPPGKAEA